MRADACTAGASCVLDWERVVYVQSGVSYFVCLACSDCSIVVLVLWLLSLDVVSLIDYVMFYCCIIYGLSISHHLSLSLFLSLSLSLSHTHTHTHARTHTHTLSFSFLAIYPSIPLLLALFLFLFVLLFSSSRRPGTYDVRVGGDQYGRDLLITPLGLGTFGWIIYFYCGQP